MALIKYCAFLRGVNVKGTNMKMANVAQVFETEGMKNVVTVLASGNVIFASNIKKELLKPLLEKAMSKHFEYESFLFIKEVEVLYTISKNNPFKAHQDFHSYFFIGVEGIEKTLLSAFEKAQKTVGEEAQIISNIFYWKVAKGNTLESTFGKILGQKNLKDSFTSRNINTLEKILKKSDL